MVSAADLKNVGGWSEDFWLYMEDVDFCKRIRNQGMRVGCTAALTLIHDHGGSPRSDENTEALCRAETVISSHSCPCPPDAQKRSRHRLRFLTSTRS
jgi:GT2 family glycosyltransferase